MLPSNMLTPISLLSIMITLHGGQTVPPQYCICYNPHVLNTTDNSTVPCNDAGCSRGDNPGCYANPDGDTIFNHRAFGVYIPGSNDYYAVVLGCNCPGFNYSADAGDNAYAYATPYAPSNDGYYTYDNCSGFSLFDLGDLAFCCNYCCSPPYVPSASSSLYSFYSLLIYILFPLAFICIKMIEPDTSESKFSTHRPNPGD